MGLLAGSGVGKSVLLGMMTRGTNADVIVVGLIGERGVRSKSLLKRYWVRKVWKKPWLSPLRLTSLLLFVCAVVKPYK